METKSFALTEVKAIGDVPGSFEAVVAVFDNVDLGGDRMVKGAFTRTLQEKGMPPVVWSHEWQVPPIGTVTSAVETDEGLLVKGRLFVGADEDHAVAKQVYAAMKAGALKEFSFGYATKASTDVVEEGKTIRQIEDVDLYEVGPTLKGMNPATRLVGVKALEEQVVKEIKAGRVLSKANEKKLTDAHALITDVIATVANDANAIANDAAETPKSSTPLTTEPEDNPGPNDTPRVSEEDRARISRLLSAAPIHIQTGDTA